MQADIVSALHFKEVRMPIPLNDVKERYIEPLEDLKVRFSDAFDDASKATRRAVRRGREAAEELARDTERAVRKHPFETAGIAFGAGLLFGALAVLLIRRK